ncbi:MAG: HigA family addiction module antidote protein [Acidobacteria bacterium]|nr:HigA family addiction module antidote protein [Acidobacteriota bacterium]
MARTPIHPGEILADELEELGMSAAELARILHVPTNRITQIIAGKRAITADTALRLGRWLGTGPELWLNLQKSYELRLAEQQIGKEIKKIIPGRQNDLPRPTPVHS